MSEDRKQGTERKKNGHGGAILGIVKKRFFQ